MAPPSALELVQRSSRSPLPSPRRALVRWLAPEMRDATLREPPDWMWEALGGQGTHADQRVTTHSALGLIPVFSCVRLLAESVAQLPLIVYRDGAGRDRARDSLQWRLLHDRANPTMPADQLWELVTGHLNLWGNAYLEKVRTGDIVTELWPINPRKVTVDREDDGSKVFTVGSAENATKLTDRDVIHIPAFGYDGKCGLSPLATARQALGVAQAREQYEGNFYANDASPGGYISHPQRLSPEALSNLRESWDASHRGAALARRPAIFEEGMTWHSVGIPLEDQQFIEGHRFTVGQIARLFRVPPEMVGGDSGGSLTYSTVEGQALHFVKFSLGHWLVRIEKALYADDDLFPDKALYPEFLVEGLLRGDSGSRADFYTKMRGIGVLSPNEIRALENLPPREGGDVYQDNVVGAAPNASEPAQDGTGGTNGTRGHLPDPTPLRTPHFEGSLS